MSSYQLSFIRRRRLLKVPRIFPGNLSFPIEPALSSSRASLLIRSDSARGSPFCAQAAGAISGRRTLTRPVVAEARCLVGCTAARRVYRLQPLEGEGAATPGAGLIQAIRPCLNRRFQDELPALSWSLFRKPCVRARPQRIPGQAGSSLIPNPIKLTVPAP